MAGKAALSAQAVVNSTVDSATAAAASVAKTATSSKLRCGEFSDGRPPVRAPHNCGKTIMITSSHHVCVMCSVMCCSECERQVPGDFVPEERFNDPAKAKAAKDGTKQYVCRGSCWDICAKIRSEEFQSYHSEDMAKKTDQFMSRECRDFYPRPGASEDSSKDKMYRGMIMTHMLADNLGVWQLKYGIVALQAVISGQTLFDLIMNPDVRALVGPILTQLQALKLDKATDMITLYYLACKHGLLGKSDPGEEPAYFKHGQAGVLSAEAPLGLLDWIGDYMGAASLLYMSRLHKPHSGNEWSEWYLSRIVKDEGWKVLRCENEAQQLLFDQSICPGFAVLVRDEHESKSHRGVVGAKPQQCVREVLISIKGTTSGADWGINIDEAPVPFTYFSAPGEPGLTCVLHGGMYRGVQSILDNFCIRGMVRRFAEAGYAVRVTGHSLGGGAASIMTAELKRYFAEIGLKADVRGIAFAPPPCMSTNLATAMTADNTLISIVHREDPVSRLTIFSLMDLADEMREFEAEAHMLYESDAEAIKKYSLSLGKSSAMTDACDEAPAAEGTAAKKKSSAPPEERTRTEEANIQETLEARRSSTERLYIGGKVIALFQDNGLNRASLVSHDHPWLLRFRLSTSRLLSDHKLHNYVNAIRSIKMQYNILLASSPPQPGVTTAPALRSSKIQESLIAQGSEELVSARSPLSTFSRCSVCDCPPTWMYILKSAAALSRVAHNCRACGKVVCAVCAPAGDEIPDEGVNKKQSLPDRRLPLPGVGLFTEQRVCKTCYIQSYYL